MTLAERFWARVEKGEPDSCWRWLGTITKGKAMLAIGNTTLSARKAAWEVTHGVRPPRNRHVEVTCGNTLCINPAHLSCPTTEDRFWSHVTKSEGCWEWTGALAKANTPGQKHFYGAFCYRGPDKERVWSTAHRYSYELAHGPIPKDGVEWCVCHKCDNPKCVRPDHLWLGTDADNIHDMLAKGRAAHQRDIDNMKKLAGKAMGARL